MSITLYRCRLVSPDIRLQSKPSSWNIKSMVTEWIITCNGYMNIWIKLYHPLTIPINHHYCHQHQSSLRACALLTQPTTTATTTTTTQFIVCIGTCAWGSFVRVGYHWIAGCCLFTINGVLYFCGFEKRKKNRKTEKKRVKRLVLCCVSPCLCPVTNSKLVGKWWYRQTTKSIRVSEHRFIHKDCIRLRACWHSCTHPPTIYPCTTLRQY